MSGLGLGLGLGLRSPSMPTAEVRLGGSIQQKKGLVFGGNQDDVEDDSRQSGLLLYVCEVAEVLEVGAVGNGGPTCKRPTSATTAINDLAKRAHGRLDDSGIRLRGGESREQPSYSHRWAKLPTTAADRFGSRYGGWSPELAQGQTGRTHAKNRLPPCK